MDTPPRKPGNPGAPRCKRCGGAVTDGGTEHPSCSPRKRGDPDQLSRVIGVSVYKRHQDRLGELAVEWGVSRSEVIQRLLERPEGVPGE